MQRIAIVIQRYGADINGGAELLARHVAHALRPYYSIDVLTSRAHDYTSWALHYPAGEEWIDGCRVLRFDHPLRDYGQNHRVPRRPKWRWKLRHMLRWRSTPLVMRPTGDDHVDGLDFLRAQGPTMDGLLNYLRDHGHDYGAILFVTALYHPNAMGILVRPERAILVPNLHDEKAMYLPHYHRVFRAPRYILYNTEAERSVAHRLYGSDLPPSAICGVGVDLPTQELDLQAKAKRWAQTAEEFGIDEPYVFYLGRVDASKGCDELFADFLNWYRRRGAKVKLVVTGQTFMDLKRDPAIIYTGFVTFEQRNDLLSHALALIVPSRYESLSLVALEAMARGCPIIVNRRCEVLMQHVKDSGVGLGYAGDREFGTAIDKTLQITGAAREALSARARTYVEQRYSWPHVVATLRRVIDDVSATSAAAS